MTQRLVKTKTRKQPMEQRIAQLEQNVYILQHALMDLAGTISVIAKAAAHEKQQQTKPGIVLTDK